MAGLFSKARTLVMGNLHALLDKAIDLNSVEAVKQHIRDLEEALEDLQDSAATAAGAVRTAQRETQALEAQMRELDRCIEILLSDDDATNDNQALPLQARLDGLTDRLTAKRSEFVAAQTAAAQLGDAAAQLRAKHASMVEQVNTLEAMERGAKAKEQAADAIRAAGRVAGNGTDASVDNIRERIQRRSDVSDEKFARAMGDLGAATGKDVALATAAARLAERKAALAAKRAAGGTGAPASDTAAPVAS